MTRRIPHRSHLISSIPSETAILDALRGRARGKSSLAENEVDAPLAAAACARFGSVAAAIAAAGVSLRAGGPRWNRERVLAAVRRRIALGATLHPAAMLAEGRADLLQAIATHVGTIETAAELAMGRERGPKDRSG